MRRIVVSAIIISSLAIFAAAPGLAGGKSGAKVKGYAEKRGGYSYTYADSVNTYGDGRSNYGAASVYRDPTLDKQTNAGPFDHGFFFDSGNGGPHGGDSPYMN